MRMLANSITPVINAASRCDVLLEAVNHRRLVTSA
jgi:hypothetical protein